jgi:hypothetical protein
VDSQLQDWIDVNICPLADDIFNEKSVQLVTVLICIIQYNLNEVLFLKLTFGEISWKTEGSAGFKRTGAENRRSRGAHLNYCTFAFHLNIRL